MIIGYFDYKIQANHCLKCLALYKCSPIVSYKGNTNKNRTNIALHTH